MASAPEPFDPGRSDPGPSDPAPSDPAPNDPVPQGSEPPRPAADGASAPDRTRPADPAGYAWIRTLPPGQWPEASAAQLDACRDPHTGVVDHVLGVHAEHPAGLAAHLGVYRAAMSPTPGLPPVDRELIAVVVSVANGCHY